MITQLKAVIFDWAGTAVDFGSLCPVAAFQSAFLAKGIAVSASDIQQFMGIAKREHVRKVLSLPEIAAQWKLANGQMPNAQAAETLYEIVEKRLLETVADSATPTPHLAEALAAVRKRGLKIGSTTGYTRPLMERLVPAARRHGFDPDFWVASDQVAQGRPWPWMIFRNMERLEICPPAAVVKLGDTISDVEEAHNAGVWSVAVVESSSLAGKSQAEMNALSVRTRNSLFRQVRQQLADAGTHCIINNLAELAGTLDQIEHRLEKGQLPPRLDHQRRHV